MRSCCRLTWLPEAASGCPVRSANMPVSSRVGGPRLQWKPPPLHTANARQPNNRVWLRGRQANTLANGTFIYLSSRPPPPPPTSFIYWDPQCHFQEPHGNSGPCQRGGQLSHDVTAPCDWRSAAERQNSSEIQKALIFGLWNCASGYVSYNLTISL